MLQKLKAERIKAMKAKDTIAKNILSFLLSEAQKIAKSDNREVTDSDVTKAAQSVIRKNQQTLDAANTELPDIKREIEILETFLPTQYTDEQLHSIIDMLISKFPDEQRNRKIMGQLMGMLKEHGDMVDMGKASKYIQIAFDKIEADKAKS